MTKKKINDLLEQKYLLQYVSSYFEYEIQEDKEVNKYFLLGKEKLIKDIETHKCLISNNYLEYADYFDSIKVENYEEWYNSSENLINTLLDNYLLTSLFEAPSLNQLFEMFYSDLIASKKRGLKHISINHDHYFEIEHKYNYLICLNDITKFVSALMRLKLYEAILIVEFDNNPQQTEKPKPEQEAPKTFDELFYNIELVQQSIDVLKEIEPPLIDTDYNYIGKLKGIFCVWIDELQRQGIVKSYSDRKIFASLIPQKIKRFSIDESMFGKYHSKAENNYRTDIKTKVSKIKLSQNSQ